MCMGSTPRWLSGANPWKGGNAHGPRKNCRDSRMANTHNGQTSQIFFGILQLLLTLCISILTCRGSFKRTHQKGHPLPMDRTTAAGLWNTSSKAYLRAGPETTPVGPAIRNRSRRIRLRDWGSAYATRRTRKTTSSGLLFSNPDRSRKELRHLLAGTLRNCPSVAPLESIRSRISRDNHHLHRPC